jgi:hypothetical protein
MFVVAFFGLMRLGEITRSQSGEIPLYTRQITMLENEVCISITHFKYNVQGRPVQIILSSQDQKEICPVSVMKEYLKARGNKYGPLFCHPDYNPINRDYFTSRLTTALRFAGMDPTRYKAHSFRIGGASFYASLGYSDTQICILGLWKSDAFKIYIRCQRVQP